MISTLHLFQVRTIRDGLRKIGLSKINVETIHNVQGNKFDSSACNTTDYYTLKNILQMFPFVPCTIDVF